MNGLATVFVLGTGVLWLSVYGYWGALWVVSVRRHRHVRPLSHLPRIAVIVPTLNEEGRILERLEDLRHTDYPSDLISVVVVDGGSTDDTVHRVQQEIESGRAVELVRLEGARGKMEQVQHALEKVEQPIAVITDADAALDPHCIWELVRTLEDDPGTAVVAAAVRPDTRLLEERLHWWILNQLWWIEGEALSSAGISGVCYAVRRRCVGPLCQGARAEDAHLALATSARGQRVRVCPSAQATELRVPGTASELIRFRRRRGRVLIHEILQALRTRRAPLACRLACVMRLWHFVGAPLAAAGLFLLAAPLLVSPDWFWVAGVGAAFVAPPLVAVYASAGFSAERRPWWRLAAASARLVALTFTSLLALHWQWRRDRNGVRP
jgi:cellulose synthase/poly-beta-1,6-N-acetylglucosamine synthase-like glycosyltransferase